MLGLARDLTAFKSEVSVVADALTYCDMTTGPSGEPLTLVQRLDDIERRHGSGSLVMQALTAGQPELERSVGVIEAALRAIDERRNRAPTVSLEVCQRLGSASAVSLRSQVR